MSLSLTLACVWVLAASAVAFVPLRFQYLPGALLVLAALPLLLFLALQHGVWLVLAGLLVLVSMFRKPLKVLLRHLGVLK